MSQTDREREETLPKAGAIQLPAYDAADLTSLNPDALIDLLIKNEDRAPRALIDECAARGELLGPMIRRADSSWRRWNPRPIRTRCRIR